MILLLFGLMVVIIAPWIVSEADMLLGHDNTYWRQPKLKSVAKFLRWQYSPKQFAL
ncbi:MAG: hypothetical protein GY796_05375 [Chloroflexi bacterium]|nr:hypothetical protein [Chloroflexota bacterium]